MATKRVEAAVQLLNSDGLLEEYARLEFTTIEDYLDMAIDAEILRRRTGEPYRTGFLPRAVRDTFLELRPDSGLVSGAK